MDFVIGADGGNSKTDLVVAGLDGTVLARVTGSGTRPYLNGFERTVSDLVELTRSAVARAGCSGPARVGSYYLANVDFADEEQAMLAALDTAGVAERLDVRNDTIAVLRAASPHGWGIAVVGGAGINAAGVYPDGREERFLGIGTFSGDWGGGMSVAVAGIGAAVRAGDGRGPATALVDAVRSVFGADPDTAAIAAQRGDIPLEAVLGFVPTVFEVAGRGDAVAVGIVHRFADEVLDFIRALIGRMELAGSEFDIVLGGGTLQSRLPVLLDRIEAGVHALAPRATLAVLDVPPVTGAVAGALALAGSAGDAFERVRRQLARRIVTESLSASAPAGAGVTVRGERVHGERRE
jgi:N-acetylglucosamine kinase-like BadF-type ATPase